MVNKHRLIYLVEQKAIPENADFVNSSQDYLFIPP